MKNDDLFALGYAEVISNNDDEKIVNYYFDDNFERANKNNAKHMIVRKYNSTGKLISENMINLKVQVLNDGCIERIYEKTINGGDYAETHYFDDNYKYTNKEKATHMIIRECKDDGTLVMETRMTKEQSRKFL